MGFVALATVIAWAIVFAVFLFSSKGEPADLPRAMVRSIGGALALVAMAAVGAAIGAAILAAFKIRFGRIFAIGYSLAVVVLACFAGAGMTLSKWRGPSRLAKEKQEEAVYKETMRNQVNEMLRSAEQGKAPSPDSLEVPAGKAPETQTGKLGLLLNMYTRDVAATASGYEKELQDIGFMTLLNPVRLSKDEDYEDSYELLAKAEETLGKWRAKQEQLAKDFPSRLEAAGITGATKSGALEGFKKGYEKSHATSAEIWNLEEESLGHLGDLVKFLEEVDDRWHEAEGKFIFDKDADLKAFQATLAKIDECSTRQEALRKEAMGRAKKSVDEMGK